MTEKSNDFVARVAPFVAVAAVTALAVAAFAARARMLLADPYPVGVDGYYYVVQVRALLEYGQLNYAQAPPLAFVWLWPFAAVFGPVVGVKLGAAAGTALAVVPAYALARRLSGSRPAAVVGAALVATSVASQFLAAEFLKQGLGLTLALTTIVALAAALERPTRVRVAGVAALVVATLLTHKSSFAFVLLVGGPATYLALRARSPRRARAALAGVAVLAAIVVVLGALLPGRFIGPADLRLAGDAFTADAEWALPALAFPRYRLTFGHDAILAAALALWVVIDRGRKLPPLAIGLVVFAFAVAIPWLNVHDAQGVAFRLRAAVFVTLAPLAALALASIPVPARWRGVAAAAIAAALLVFRPLASREGQSHAHPALVEAVRALDGVVPPDRQVATQDRKVAFMARWYARQPMQLHPDASTDYRLMPGNWVDAELRRALDDLRAHPVAGVAGVRDLHPFEPNALVLVPEATFTYLMTRVPATSRAYYARWPTT